MSIEYHILPFAVNCDVFNKEPRGVLLALAVAALALKRKKAA